MKNNPNTDSSRESHDSTPFHRIPQGFKPRRRLGQHFLIDRRKLQRLVDCAEIGAEESILEVGAGTGNLTEILQRHSSHVIAIEKDSLLVEYLKRRFKGKPGVKIIEGDVLKIELPQFDKVVSSPPYGISSRLLFTLLEKRFKSATLVFQKEFAERLVAKAGTRDYGRLTVMLQSRATADLLEFVPRTAFQPSPKVDSFIVQIRKKNDTDNENTKTFHQVVRAMFSQRRRIASTVLRHWLERNGISATETIINSLDIPAKRVFELTIDDFKNISRNLQQHNTVELTPTGG